MENVGKIVKVNYGLKLWSLQRAKQIWKTRIKILSL